MFKLPYRILVVFLVVYSAYSAFVLYKCMTGTLKGVPRFHSIIQKTLNSFDFLSDFLLALQRKYYLIYLDKTIAEVFSVTLLSLYPVFGVIIFNFLGNFSNKWYLLIPNFFFAFIIPFLFIKNSNRAKCSSIRKSMVDSYMSLVILLTQNKMDSCIYELQRSTNGNVSKIYKIFSNKYNKNKAEAYQFLLDVVGDNYTDTVVKNLIKYEEYGVAPLEEVTRICEHALDMFAIEELKRTKLKQVKLFAFGAIPFNLVMDGFARKMVSDVGGGLNSIFLYISMLILTTVLLLAFLYDNN